MKKQIPISELQRLLQYDPLLGSLTWLSRSVDMFAKANIARTWNTRFAGKLAFTAIVHTGYCVGGIHGSSFLAHRVAWALHYGEWPTDQIDHINGIRNDNRIVNLRAATNAENGKNQKLRNTSQTGQSGVCWHKLSGKWQARINVNGVTTHVGLFNTIDDAIAARIAAEQLHDYHANHGKR
jgi:hypothetical protein